MSWYNLHSDDDFSGYKFATIALGVNDAYKNIGAWNANSISGITQIVAKLRASNTNIPIFITTPPSLYSRDAKPELGAVVMVLKQFEFHLIYT